MQKRQNARTRKLPALMRRQEKPTGKQAARRRKGSVMKRRKTRMPL